MIALATDLVLPRVGIECYPLRLQEPIPGRPMNIFRLCALVCVISVVASVTGAAADQVTRRSDRVTFRGEFTAMTPSLLTIRQQNGQTQDIPVSDVLVIRFDMEPPALSQAQSSERGGALDVALQKYRQIQSEYSGEDSRLVADLKFLIARTQVRIAFANPAEVAGAAKAIRDFRTENKSNFRVLEATLLEAELLSLDPEKTEEARALLGEVQKSDVKGYRLQAGVQLGLLLLAGRDTAGALTAFEGVLQESAGDAGASAAFYDASLGKAMCQKADGKSDEAIATLNEVIGKASESETRTLARAWVLKGDCLREKGLPKDALLAYLHVDVLYSSEPSSHAEALFHLGSLWGPAGHQNRADDARAQLASRYPNSSWAKKTAN